MSGNMVYVQKEQVRAFTAPRIIARRTTPTRVRTLLDNVKRCGAQHLIVRALLVSPSCINDRARMGCTFGHMVTGDWLCIVFP